MLGPGPRLIKKILPGRGLTKVEKHWSNPPLGLRGLLQGTFTFTLPYSFLLEDDSNPLPSGW